jgi:hypothetical protein
MLRPAVFAVALTGLAVLTLGVLDAVPLVFWGTGDEREAIEQGRTTMLIGAGLVLATAAALRSAPLGLAGVLPTALALALPDTAHGLLALPVAVGAGAAGAAVGCLPAGDRGRLGASATLGVLVVLVAVAAGASFAVVLASALVLVAYTHARAGGAQPRAAVASLAPGAGLALLAGSAVLAGGVLAA